LRSSLARVSSSTPRPPKGHIFQGWHKFSAPAAAQLVDK
jgi:hypothetical protein